MLMVIGVEVTPVRYWGALSGMIGAVLATGSVLGTPFPLSPVLIADRRLLLNTGPILGGVITEKASWRWIYLFNTPAAAAGIAVMLFCWPRKDKMYTKPKISWQSLRQVDWLGAVLLLAASTLLVFALQEAGSRAFTWSSATIVSTLTISGACWIGFFAWISWLSFSRVRYPRAIFPFTIALTRPVGPAIVCVDP